MTTELASGQILLGRYRLDRRIDEGGMSVVWGATHTLTGKQVALKLLKADAARDEATRRRMVREARAACAVVHPNVVQIHDVLELPDGSPVLVMDLLTGEPLRERLVRRGALPLDETATLLVPVISALGTAHAAGVIHRDLKPENIFLAQEAGRLCVKVLDFGIAKLVPNGNNISQVNALTSAGTLLGTPFYMAPEQILEEPIDHRADVWALGVILYECLAGERPTEAENVGKVLKRVLTNEITPLSRRAPELPEEVTALVDRMMSQSPDDRPSSLHEVGEALAPFAHGVSVGSFGPPSRVPEVESGERRSGDGASGGGRRSDPAQAGGRWSDPAQGGGRRSDPAQAGARRSDPQAAVRWSDPAPGSAPWSEPAQGMGRAPLPGGPGGPGGVRPLPELAETLMAGRPDGLPVRTEGAGGAPGGLPQGEALTSPERADGAQGEPLPLEETLASPERGNGARQGSLPLEETLASPEHADRTSGDSSYSNPTVPPARGSGRGGRREESVYSESGLPSADGAGRARGGGAPGDSVHPRGAISSTKGPERSGGREDGGRTESDRGGRDRGTEGAGGGRARVAAMVLGALAVAAGAVLGVLYLRRGKERPPYVPASASVVPVGGGPCPAGMGLVQGGVLKMGSEDGKDDERPVHELNVASFCLDLTEVRGQDYSECMQRGECRPAESTVRWEGLDEPLKQQESVRCTFYQTANRELPMNCVSWSDADAYCRAAGGRLPTEIEWEYAAAGGAERRPYPWGREAPGPLLVNVCDRSCADADGVSGGGRPMFEGDDGAPTLAKVGSYPKGASRFGMLDMAGNVWEWTASPYCTYPEHQCSSPHRVFRGGGWGGRFEANLRSSARMWSHPAHRYNDVGFRCARDLR